MPVLMDAVVVAAVVTVDTDTPRQFAAITVRQVMVTNMAATADRSPIALRFRSALAARLLAIALDSAAMDRVDSADILAMDTVVAGSRSDSVVGSVGDLDLSADSHQMQCRVQNPARDLQRIASRSFRHRRLDRR